MKFPLPYLVATLLVVAMTGCDKIKKDPEDKPAATGETAGLTTDEQKISYIMGMNIGTQFKSDDFTVDMKTFTNGIEDAIAGASLS